MAEKNFLTKEWYEKLLEELKDLKEEKLPSILSKLKEAAWHWDISENAEYETAMAEKDLIESRISQLEELLDNVEIIKSDKKSASEVRYSSKVVLEDEKWKQYEYVVVGSWEVNVLEWTISFESPVWVAIKGKKEWDTVSVRSPRGRMKMKILKIS